MTARIKRVRPVQARKEMKSISPREREILARAREQALTFENRMFGEMYATAIERRLLEDDDGLYKFLSHLEQAPVDIETFIDDPQFLGATDLTLWPEVRKAIVDINKDWWKGRGRGAYHEAMLMGACVDADTEFLTPDGWKSIADYRPGDLVGQYHSDGSVTFVTPQRYVRYRAEEFLHFNPRGGVNMALTEGHRVIYKHHKTGEIQEISAEDLRDKQRTLKGGFKGKFITTFSVPGRVGIPLSDEEIRVMVMVHADGSFYERTAWCNLVVKKPRKVARAVELLEAAGIPYRRTDRPDGYTRIQFYAPERNKTYEGWMNCTEAQLRVVTDEVIFWDGNDQHRQFYTAKREEADFIQYAYAATGTRATMQWQDRGGSRSTEYRVKACKNDTISLQNSGDCITALPSPDGYCYCFTLDTGMWVMRRAGSIAITGNTGTGKTSICMVSVLYTAHILGCLKQPQSVYGLPKATAIVIPIMAAKPHVTKKVVYRPLRKLMEDIPWFQSHMKMDPQVESEIDLKEKNVRIVVGGADEDSILGEAVIGGIIDEINFMNVVLRSKKAEVTSGRAGVYDQAKNIYETMTRRKKGRFITKGPCVGVIFASSSTRYKGDFTDKRKEHIDRVGEKGVYIYNKKQYEVWPQDRYSGKTFRLLVGNDTLSDTRVLEEGEKVPEGALVYDVPVEYEDDFRKNPHDALRDVLGLSTTSIAPFIKRRFTVLECIKRGEEEGLQSFLEKDNVELGRDGMPLVKRGHYCANPSRPRYVHIDLSLSQDRCGIAMLRFDGLRKVERDGGMIEMLPECSVELACSIAPDANSEIQIAEVRMWVKQLRDVYGYPIKVVTYDGTMSVESRQQWKKEGAKTGYVSVDRTSVPYKQLRDGISDGRVKMFEQPVLVQELFDLEYDGDKDKIDHPVNGCFVAGTLVSTEHGALPIESVEPGMQVWSYGASPELRTVIAGGVTKYTTELVDVHLANGSVVRCTPEHLFLLSDGTYKQAQNLTDMDDLRD